MRILEVTEASGSGTFEMVRTIAAGAAGAGHDVLVALGTRPETPADPGSLLPEGIELAILPWSSRSPRAQLSAARALRRLATSWAPDVVHLHSSFAGVVGALALPRHVPVVYTSHGSPAGRRSDPWVKRTTYRAAESLAARRAAVVGAVSEAEADVARRLLGASRVVVVPNGISELDPGREPAVPARPEALVVAIGRITAARRPAETSQILGAVRDLAAVRWIGGAAAREDAPVLAAGIPVTGWLAREEGLTQLADSTVCVHWSGWDGMSLALLEAIARDVVVVASDIPANREVVGPGQVRSTVPEAIELVRRVLTDEDLRAGMLAEQRARRERFGAARSVAAWLDLYGRLAVQS
jgi:glycosyltransferase involved in cell wall biosynthesis